MTDNLTVLGGSGLGQITRWDFSSDPDTNARRIHVLEEPVLGMTPLPNTEDPQEPHLAVRTETRVFKVACPWQYRDDFVCQEISPEFDNVLDCGVDTSLNKVRVVGNIKRKGVLYSSGLDRSTTGKRTPCSERIRCASFSPSNKKYFYLTGTDHYLQLSQHAYSVKKWNIKSLSRINGRPESLTAISDAECVLNYGDGLSVYDVPSMRVKKTFKRGANLVVSGNIAGKQFATSNNEVVSIWNLRDAKPTATINEDRRHGKVFSLNFRPSENMLLTGFGDGSIAFWDVRKSSTPSHILTSGTAGNPVISIAVTDGGRKARVKDGSIGSAISSVTGGISSVTGGIRDKAREGLQTCCELVRNAMDCISSASSFSSPVEGRSATVEAPSSTMGSVASSSPMGFRNRGRSSPLEHNSSANESAVLSGSLGNRTTGIKERSSREGPDQVRDRWASDTAQAPRDIPMSSVPREVHSNAAQESSHRTLRSNSHSSNTANPASPPMPTEIPEDRFVGCLVGLAVGDALGTTVEFHPRGSFSPVIGMVGGGPFMLNAGEWTDDTSMALCLAESLTNCGQFDMRDQLTRYVDWMETGHLSSNGRCFDIGNTVRQALMTFKHSGRQREKCGDPPESSNAGNGSLMRLAPVPMAFALYPQHAIDYSGRSSQTTHGSQIAIDACRYYSGLIVGALHGKNKQELLSPCFKPGPNYWALADLCREVQPIVAGGYKDKSREEIRGSGYVVEAMEAALWCFYKTETFKEGALMAVNLGDDADTTAAIYGQLAGAYYGFQGIPAEFHRTLAHKSKIVDFAKQLYAIAMDPLSWVGRSATAT